jgi:hypothetical protein
VAETLALPHPARMKQRASATQAQKRGGPFMAAASIAPSRRLREDLMTVCPVISCALPLKEARECVFAAGS